MPFESSCPRCSLSKCAPVSANRIVRCPKCNSLDVYRRHGDGHQMPIEVIRTESHYTGPCATVNGKTVPTRKRYYTWAEWFVPGTPAANNISFLYLTPCWVALLVIGYWLGSSLSPLQAGRYDDTCSVVGLIVAAVVGSVAVSYVNKRYIIPAWIRKCGAEAGAMVCRNCHTVFDPLAVNC